MIQCLQEKGSHGWKRKPAEGGRGVHNFGSGTGKKGPRGPGLDKRVYEGQAPIHTVF